MIMPFHAALKGHVVMQKPLLIGFAGGSAAGKSTLTAALTEAIQTELGLTTKLIMADRYMKRDAPNAPTFTSPSTGEVLFNANHPESVVWEQLFVDLDQLLAQPDCPTVIIIEGLMVLHQPRMRERLDIRCFVELDDDERALRRMLRDMTGVRGLKDPAAIAAYYRECARVGHLHYVEPSRVHADLILRGDADWLRVRPLLLAMIADRAQALS
jgi:uridine kinase